MIELYIQKLVRLVQKGLITLEDIKDPVYRAEVENRLSQ